MGVKKTNNKPKQTNKHNTTTKHTRAQWNRIKKPKQPPLAQTPNHQLKWYWVEVLRALGQKSALRVALDQVYLESRR